MISYNYLWAADAAQGKENSKARPCAIILAVEQKIETVSEAGTKTETHLETVVVPITHSPPRSDDDPETYVALPAAACRAAGLDNEPHWIIVSEYNRFIWPGFDLAPRRVGKVLSFEYCVLPPGIFAEMRRKWLAIVRAKKATATLR